MLAIRHLICYNIVTKTLIYLCRKMQGDAAGGSGSIFMFTGGAEKIDEKETLDFFSAPEQKQRRTL